MNHSREHSPLRVGFGALAEISGWGHCLPAVAGASRVGLGILAETDFVLFCQRKPHNDIGLFVPAAWDPQHSTTNSHLIQGPLDYVPDIEGGRTISVSFLHQTIFDCADFFGRLLRSNIICPDIKDHVFNKLEGVIQH